MISVYGENLNSEVVTQFENKQWSSTESLPSSSESQSRRDLNLTRTRSLRGLNVRDRSKWSGAERRVRRRVIHVVQQICRLSAYLKPQGFPDPDGLH